MNQLYEKFYSRDQIAELLKLDCKNTNFARKVKDTLSNWGYSYEYSRKGVNITRKPQTPIEKLSEIMIRVYDIDIQIDAFAFASFLFLLLCDETFITMPWGERQRYMKEEMNVDVSERTLKSWASKLIKKDMLHKDKSVKEIWGTAYLDGGKVRFQVFGDINAERQMEEYMNDRTKTLEKYISNEKEKGRKDWKAIYKEAWQETINYLWSKYNCCYYCCSRLVLNAIGDEAQEIFELVNEIQDTDYVVVCNTSIVGIQVKPGEFVF